MARVNSLRSNPVAQRHIKLAYDAARGRLALYGGYDDAGREMYSERHHLGRDLREARAALAVGDFVSVRVGKRGGAPRHLELWHSGDRLPA